MTQFKTELQTTATMDAARAALTTPEGIKGWWSTDSKTATEVGGAVEMTFVKGDRTVVMKFVIDALEDRRVAWTCTENGNPIWPGTTLTWDLAPAGNGTQITFTHAGFEDANHPAYAITVGENGWGHFMASLKGYLDNGVGQPW